MLKEDCLHQISWSLVAPGTKADRIDLEGIEMRSVSPENMGALATVQAELLEQSLNQACKNLPDELNLAGEHFSEVEKAVVDFMDLSRASLLIPEACSEMDENEEKVLSRLRALAEEERQRGNC